MSSIFYLRGQLREMREIVGNLDYDRLLVVSDDNVWPLFLNLTGEDYRPVADCLTVVKAGEATKRLETVEQIVAQWKEHGATRHSLLLNIGGGMVSDLGGFAAAIYMRGIRYVNVPTTLLAMVDASVGGKTAVNSGGVKNLIGAFHSPLAIITSDAFLKSLPPEELLSGYGEMLKHGLLDSEDHFAQLLNGSPAEVDIDMVKKSATVKEELVCLDPYEDGPRKRLNLGHTIGHALEALMLEHGSPMAHGIAVAWGLLGALYLSTHKEGLPISVLRRLASFVTENYPRPDFTCGDYDALLALMSHDKKNDHDTIRFTLLKEIGHPLIHIACNNEEIKEALDFVREGF